MSDCTFAITRMRLPQDVQDVLTLLLEIHEPRVGVAQQVEEGHFMIRAVRSLGSRLVSRVHEMYLRRQLKRAIRHESTRVFIARIDTEADASWTWGAEALVGFAVVHRPLLITTSPAVARCEHEVLYGILEDPRLPERYHNGLRRQLRDFVESLTGPKGSWPARRRVYMHQTVLF